MSGLAEFVWQSRYRDPQSAEDSVADSWNRVATAVAAAEADPGLWRRRFLDVLQDYRFLPGGRILAGAGTAREVTLFNCFVMGPPGNSIESIFRSLRECALTMQQGGGVGLDFSAVRPRDGDARQATAPASGPVALLALWDAMCAAIESGGARRGAMMATLRCDHPDIEGFIAAKRTPQALQHFNLSVLVSDNFLRAVQDDAEWPLVFGGGRIPRVVAARELWRQLCDSAYDSAEPGVLFIDRINAANNLAYCETLSATNPCGEVPLPAYGACNLGSLNLTRFVIEPFTPAAGVDFGALGATTAVAVRFLDNVIDLSGFPLPIQREQARRTRRIGIGITGLADALAMLGLRYDGQGARDLAARALRTVRDAAYLASAQLARERGPFPAFDARLYATRPYIQSLPAEIQAEVGRHGIRNSHLIAIAPAGTISLLAGNVSSGIEPIFALEAVRHVLDRDGVRREFQATDYAYALWRRYQSADQSTPPSFVEHQAIAPADQLRMQAALQPYVDSAISKTITLAGDRPRSDIPEIFRSAYDLGLKGCTVYRPVARPGVISGCR